MKIRNWVLLIGLFAFASLILCTLIFFTDKPNNKENGFLRKGLNLFATPLHEMNLNNSPNRIAGFTKDHILISEKQPNILATYDWQLKHGKTDTFSMPFNLNVISSYEINVDSPFISLYAGNLSAKLSYRLHDTIAHGLFLKTPLFTRVVSISSERLALRAFDSTRKHQVLKIANVKTGNIIEEKDIFPDQSDGGFGTDGWLRYDNMTHRILYISIFSNSYYCLDSNLTLIYKSRTIDTTNTNPVTTHTYITGKNEESMKPATPLKVINRECCVSNGHLYIVSSLKADNENRSDFINNTIMDIYDIKTGKYEMSFYVPNKDHRKLKDIRIFNNNTLVVLYTDAIATFQITG